MSGVRQHFIPRFLQKGFRIPSNGKVIRTWVYEQGRPPRSANIADVALERHFYAAQAESELDEKITDAERDFYAPLVEQLRLGNLDDQALQLIPEMLAHFEVRGRHVRENMDSLFDECTEELIGYLSDPQILNTLLMERATPDSEVLKNALAEAGISYGQLRQILDAGGVTFEDVLRPFVSISAAAIASALPIFRPKIPEMVKGAHLRVLGESISPAARGARLSTLTYSIQSVASGDLPLGDSISLFHIKGERAFKPFLDKDDELVQVILPLSSRQYLVGVAEGVTEELAYDLHEQIARCSMKQFICGSDKMTELQDHIGSNARWISTAQTKLLIDEVVQEMMPSTSA